MDTVKIHGTRGKDIKYVFSDDFSLFLPPSNVYIHVYLFANYVCVHEKKKEPQVRGNITDTLYTEPCV